MMLVHFLLTALLVVLCGLTVCWAQEIPTVEPSDTERIITPEEVEEALDKNRAILPIRIISYPHRAITRGMEKGLITVEKKHLRERMRFWTDRLHDLGITP